MLFLPGNEAEPKMAANASQYYAIDKGGNYKIKKATRKLIGKSERI